MADSATTVPSEKWDIVKKFLTLSPDDKRKMFNDPQFKPVLSPIFHESHFPAPEADKAEVAGN